ncbi:MAG: 30S ribosomal protein S18 [Anaerolineae bacterium]|nr:30S ribosomal protein S18 [Anaerolineae bacterium]
MSDLDTQYTDDIGGDEEQLDRRSGRRGGRRRRVCPFCGDKIREVDYKDADLLRRYVNEEGKIRPRRQTNVCARHQRSLAQAVKRARHLALLPFTGQHVHG